MICAGGLGKYAPIPYPIAMAMTLAEKIKAIRLALGKDQTEFGEELDASQSTVARWERGAQPKPEALRRIAEIGKTSVDSLLGLTEGETIDGHPVRWVPLVGRAPAGNWREAIEVPIGEVAVRADKAGRNAFAVEIDGDSMDLILPEGGWAVIDPDQRNFFDKRVYLVMNGDGDATLKRYLGNPARLVPVSRNDAHGDIMLTGEAITIIGRVVAYGNDEGL